MKKKKSPKTLPRQVKRATKDITTTSVAFKTENLDYLKAHDMHVRDSLSISWIINRMIANLRDRGGSLE